MLLQWAGLLTFCRYFLSAVSMGSEGQDGTRLSANQQMTIYVSKETGILVIDRE
jgi:hypothetical protein